MRSGGKGSGEQPVACQHRIGFPIYLVVGGLAPAEIVIIHTGQIVVNEGVGVHHFQPTGEGEGILFPAPKQPAHRQGQGRTDPFSAGE